MTTKGLFRIALLLVLGIVGCKDSGSKNGSAAMESPETATVGDDDRYRPQYHFTPHKGWMNDPNGMFYYNNYYHLYYQHYPDGNKWGPMHWGHAITTDLVTWKEMPIALYPDEQGYIFSGSAVVDHDNTSGFGTDGIAPIIAMFTYHDPEKATAKAMDVESQAIAYSLDEGLTWKKYEGNPVIKNPGARDFRDPKVSWDEAHQQWIMVLAAGQQTYFYKSANLKDWELLSTFGEGIGNHDGVWECPDLFPLQVAGSDETKWVHLVSINPGGPNGGSATQYFIGDFDGTRFTVDPEFEKAMMESHDFWTDFGKDNYAGVTWSNIATSDGAKLFIGWMSNWQYANEVPTETWRSAMTLPRELRLVQSEGIYRLVCTPSEEIKGFRGKKYAADAIAITGETKLIDSKTIDLSRAELLFNISDGKGIRFSLTNDMGDSLSFGYDPSAGQFYIDRSKSGKTEFSEHFGDAVSTAPRISKKTGLTARALLDKTSIELFFDEGMNVMTEIVFPNAPFTKLVVHSEGELTIDHLEIHELNVN